MTWFIISVNSCINEQMIAITGKVKSSLLQCSMFLWAI